jgi:hypothetical protein
MAMKRTGINSAEARRRVRIAQFAGLGLGVLAAALWIMDVPGLSHTLPGKPAVPSLGAGSSAPEMVQVVRIAHGDPVGIAERLDLAANRPAVPAPTGGETEPPPPPPPAATTQWKYLGAIEEPTRLLALVSLKGRQKIVSEGTELKIMTPAAEGRPEAPEYAATIMEIKREHIVIEEEGGARQTIPLEGKTAKVAWVKNMPTTVQGANGAALASAMSAETRQRLIAQGIDPAQAERARQAAALAARGRAVPGAEQPATIMTAANQKQAAGDATGKAAPNSSRTRAVPTADTEVANDGAKGTDRTGTVN